MTVKQEDLDLVRRLARDERKVYPFSFSIVSKEQQAENYTRATWQRVFFWEPELLDAYAREGEDQFKGRFGKLKKFFTNDLYHQRLVAFQATADEQFANECGYTLRSNGAHYKGE